MRSNSPESLVQPVIEDPMLANFELGFRRVYYPLGFPLELQTNSRDVIEAASEGWGLFSQAFEIAPLRLSLGVREAQNSEPLPLKSTFIAREHLLAIVADAANFVMCDFDQSFSFGWITSAVASDYATLRYRILIPPTMMMAEQLALAPLHGALIARNDCGVLLCGESFAGKSTLAYACARSGWTYISDDGTFLVRNRSDRYAVGDPHSIRFREDARELFPELADRLVVTRPNGKIGMELFTRELPIAIAPGARIEHVVFLDRYHHGSARLRSYPKDLMQTWCRQFANFGNEHVRADMICCQQQLLGASVWELSYRNLDDAVRRLDQLVGFGG